MEWRENGIATLQGLVLGFSWIALTKVITKYKLWSSITGRKVIHIGTGPLYILSWNIFPRVHSARYFGALLPFAIVLNFALVGLGILKDEETVRSMSRTGNRKELLYGPLLYGIIFVLSAATYWGDSPLGITALMLLCVGDGSAGFFGERYGRTKLPWNKQKTWVGLFCFFTFSIIITSIYVDLFHNWGWFSVTVSQFFPSLVLATAVGTMVESLPGFGDWDNVTVFLSSLGTLHFLGW